MEVGDHVEDVELMPFRNVDVRTMSVMFDIIGMAGIDMFVRHDDKVFVKFPFRRIFRPKIDIGGRDVLLAYCWLYAYFSGRSYKVNGKRTNVEVDCQSCKFKAVTSINPRTTEFEEISYLHSPDCMRQYCAGTGGLVAKEHNRYVRRALMMAFSVRFVRLDFERQSEKVLVDQLKAKYNDNLGSFMEVNIDDTRAVYNLLNKLNGQKGMDLYDDFFKCFTLFHSVRCKNGWDPNNKPMRCKICQVMTPTLDEHYRECRWLDLDVNGLVANPCDGGCIEMCSICFMKLHMLPGKGNSSDETGYYNGICTGCNKVFIPGKIAKAVIGKHLIDTVPYKDCEGRLLYVDVGEKVLNSLILVYESTKVLIPASETTGHQATVAEAVNDVKEAGDNRKTIVWTMMTVFCRAAS